MHPWQKKDKETENPKKVKRCWSHILICACISLGLWAHVVVLVSRALVFSPCSCKGLTWFVSEEKSRVSAAPHAGLTPHTKTQAHFLKKLKKKKKLRQKKRKKCLAQYFFPFLIYFINIVVDWSVECPSLSQLPSLSVTACVYVIWKCV